MHEARVFLCCLLVIVLLIVLAQRVIGVNRQCLCADTRCERNCAHEDENVFCHADAQIRVTCRAGASPAEPAATGAVALQFARDDREPATVIRERVEREREGSAARSAQQKTTLQVVLYRVMTEPEYAMSTGDIPVHRRKVQLWKNSNRHVSKFSFSQ
jgi:hypothetical protein